MALTASGLGEAKAEALAVGADEVLWKPYREAQLLESIGALLGLRYRYAEIRPTFDSARPGASATELLPDLLRICPEGLLGELRTAAMQARPERIEALAKQVAEISAEAAGHIRALASAFEYERLTSAVEAAGRRPAP